MAHANDPLVSIATRYVEQRDSFAKRYKDRASGLLPISTTGGPIAFDMLVGQHAEDMARQLPPMNLAQWEGLAELVNAKLNRIRMDAVR